MIPKNKHDIAAIKELAHATDQEVVNQAEQLLEWLQDANWPVFEGVCQRLSVVGKELVEPVSTILDGNDAIWKANVVGHLMELFSAEDLELYRDILEKFQNNCGLEDIKEDALDYVDVLLINMGKNT